MQDLIDKALTVFLKNDYWREYYETSPSEECKRYIEREFAESYLFFIDECFEHVAEKDSRKALEHTLSINDWKHLLKYAGNNPFRGYCKNKIKELEKTAERMGTVHL